MIWLTKASRGTQDAVIGHTLRIMHAVHSKRENEIVDREQEPITMGQLFEPQHLVNVGAWVAL